mmetsp:Transcript_7047/g.21998  ORF Transcript_7047/g.21998 Transcript_7047/m.21998 type:complete len:232 (+) Transcript_7047:756-1451(+)
MWSRLPSAGLSMSVWSVVKSTRPGAMAPTGALRASCSDEAAPAAATGAVRSFRPRPLRLRPELRLLLELLELELRLAAFRFAGLRLLPWLLCCRAPRFGDFRLPNDLRSGERRRRPRLRLLCLQDLDFRCFSRERDLFRDLDRLLDLDLSARKGPPLASVLTSSYACSSTFLTFVSTTSALSLGSTPRNRPLALTISNTLTLESIRRACSVSLGRLLLRTNSTMTCAKSRL